MEDRVIVSRGEDRMFRWRRVGGDGNTLAFGTQRCNEFEACRDDARRINRPPFILELGTTVDDTLTTDISQGEVMVFAPFTTAQVDHIATVQQGPTAVRCARDDTHPVLEGRTDGLHCPQCGFHQIWAPEHLTGATAVAAPAS